MSAATCKNQMMKKLLPLLLLTFILCSCNGHKPAVNHNHDIPADSAKSEDNANDEKLVLNDGLKWKVDDRTNYNAHCLLAVLDKINKTGDQAPLTYQAIQDDLQASIDTMIAQCKMKGADHLALHKWLEPLMGQVAKLKNVSTVSDARLVLKAINKQAGLYPQYFEVSTNGVPTEKKL